MSEKVALGRDIQAMLVRVLKREAIIDESADPKEMEAIATMFELAQLVILVMP